MYEIRFYKDAKGREPVLEYLKSLLKKKDKSSRIKANKIKEYLDLLSEYGTALGEPYVKHLEGKLYELRPLKDRIIFAKYTGKEFLLLSHFIKDTQKTPAREMEKARKRYAEYKEREKK